MDIKKVCPFFNIGNRIEKVGEKVLESISVDNKTTIDISFIIISKGFKECTA